MIRLCTWLALCALVVGCNGPRKMTNRQADAEKAKPFIQQCLAVGGKVVNMAHYTNGKYTLTNPSCIWDYK